LASTIPYKLVSKLRKGGALVGLRHEVTRHVFRRAPFH